MKWDDLKLFLAIAELGTLAGAARRLNQNHSTVFRRLNRLEQDLQTRLFERLNEGYLLTPVGERLLELATQVDHTIDHIEREVAGRDMDPSGSVRLTTAANIATTLLPAFVAHLRQQHPGIVLEISVGDSDFDLGRREADLALRATNQPPEQLVGRKLADLQWWLCGPKRWRRRLSIDDKLDELPLIGADRGLMRLDAFRWLEQRYHESIVVRCNDLSTAAALARQGVGYTVLPSDHRDAGLQQLFEIPHLKGELWLLAHPDVRRAQRIQVVWQALAEQIPALLNT